VNLFVGKSFWLWRRSFVFHASEGFGFAGWSAQVFAGLEIDLIR
jgi:hypothetical protein